MNSTTNTVGTGNCGCGCGTEVLSRNANYAPGHDARHVGIIARAILAESSLVKQTALVGTLPSPALRFKATAMVARLREPKTSKSVKATRSPSSTVEGTVKIGRWTYPARKLASGQVVRNTQRDGSGEWVPVSSSGRNSVGAETFRAA